MRCRAVLPNHHGFWLAGMSARVRLPMGAPRKALLAPVKAYLVHNGATGLWVADDQKVLEFRDVNIGLNHDGMLVAEEGLKPHEWVVVNPSSELQKGMKVEIERVSATDASARDEGKSARP
jgi:multidrug efflux pump subunit AcrA (membrane-fusion protein)